MRRQRMLPVCRTESEGFAIPQFAVDHGDVEGLLHELRGFHDAFHERFARSATSEPFFHYTAAPRSALERKSIQTIALRGAGGRVQAMPWCLSEVVWDDEQMLRTYHRLVDEDMGDPEGVVIF